MKKKNEKKKLSKEVKVSLPPEEAKEKNNRFDFGGLPERDLKKNLGCG